MIEGEGRGEGRKENLRREERRKPPRTEGQEFTDLTNLPSTPGSPGGSVKHLPAMRETWVQSLRREDPLEKEMATHSSTLAWKIPWTEEPGRI